jgi:hypothetical protein
MNEFLTKVLRGIATRDQAKDTGMAVVLILLIAALARKKFGYVDIAIVVHVINMIAPQVFRPAAVVWFGFSHVMGNVVSRLIMAIVFFLVVTPIGVWRRLSGADALQLKPFKAGRGSVMEERNHTFTGKDIEQPY